MCAARCLPRKELYEAWEVARRTRRRFRGGRVVDAGGGHGLLAHLMLLLDDTSPRALVVDPGVPRSAARVQEVISRQWPRAAGRVSFVTATIDEFQIESGDVVVSCHACGALTDRVLARAAGARARVAVLPCCHDVETCEVGPLRWMGRSGARHRHRTSGEARRRTVPGLDADNPVRRSRRRIACSSPLRANATLRLGSPTRHYPSFNRDPRLLGPGR